MIYLFEKFFYFLIPAECSDEENRKRILKQTQKFLHKNIESIEAYFSSYEYFIFALNKTRRK